VLDWRDGVVLIAGGGALALAGLLAWQAGLGEQLPPGCGRGSGCEQVLTSRYARLFGLPVGLFAVIGYLGLLVGWIAMRYRAAAVRPGGGGDATHAAAASAEADPGRAAVGVVFLAAGALAGALWFTGLQLFVLKAVCGYCLVDHALGVLAAGVALPAAWRLARPNRPACAAAAAVAVLLISTAAGVQHAQHTPAHVSLLDGRIAFDIAGQPHRGPADSPRRVMMLFDYACPHCRDVHQVVRNGTAERPAMLMVWLPVSIWPGCNDMFTSMGERFAHSCELAELALAVHAIDRQAFFTFDRWLFDWPGDGPRDLAAARARAGELVGDAALQRELNSGRPGEALQRNIDVFRAIAEAGGARIVPTLLLGDQPVRILTGGVDQFDQVESLLDADFSSDGTSGGSGASR